MVRIKGDRSRVGYSSEDKTWATDTVSWSSVENGRIQPRKSLAAIIFVTAHCAEGNSIEIYSRNGVASSREPESAKVE